MLSRPEWVLGVTLVVVFVTGLAFRSQFHADRSSESAFGVFVLVVGISVLAFLYAVNAALVLNLPGLREAIPAKRWRRWESLAAPLVPLAMTTCAAILVLTGNEQFMSIGGMILDHRNCESNAVAHRMASGA
jgi:hypothetical protein